MGAFDADTMEFSEEQIQVLLNALRVLSASQTGETHHEFCSDPGGSDEDGGFKMALLQYLFEEAYESDPLAVLDALEIQ